MEYFFDPIFRAPMFGSIFICIATALIGVFTLLKKQSLLGESLSHTTYPGVMLGAVLSSATLLHDAFLPTVITLFFAFLSAVIGLRLIHWLTNKANVRKDAALCFVLSLFFGIGVVIASRIQITNALLYQKMQTYFYGQAATLNDLHILLYFTITALLIGFIWYAYHIIQVSLFDQKYAKQIGVHQNLIESILFAFLVLSIVMGIRSVGIVLISGMLIAPALAAKQFTSRLSTLFIGSGAIGALSAVLGNLFSYKLSNYLEHGYFPTGPSIVLVSIAIAVASLVFSPSKGLLIRKLRIFRFKRKCMKENILKSFWKAKNYRLSYADLMEKHSISKVILFYSLWRLRQQGWAYKRKNIWGLTKDGTQKAAQIIRLHRLWELYLVENLGLKADLVHRSAEQMEHILTADMEKRLTSLLSNPTKDPHKQPIPDKGGF